MLLFGTPLIVSFNQPIDFNAVNIAPDFAFGFYQIDDSSIIVNDPTIFTYNLEQFTLQYNKQANGAQTQTSTKVNFQPCTPTWAPIQIQYLCPTQPLIIRGIIGQGQLVQYPKLELIECVNSLSPLVVCNQSKIQSIFATGRLFVITKKQGQVNLVTRKRSKDSGLLSQFFVVPSLYDRGEVGIQRVVTTTFPDYVNTFSQTQDINFQIATSTLLVSNTTAIEQTTVPIFLWTMNLLSSEVHEKITYFTIVDCISLWGGMWSVLAAAFMLYFLKYNLKSFYGKHKAWDRFDRHLKTHTQETYKIELFEEQRKKEQLKKEEEERQLAIQKKIDYKDEDKDDDDSESDEEEKEEEDDDKD